MLACLCYSQSRGRLITGASILWVLVCVVAAAIAFATCRPGHTLLEPEPGFGFAASACLFSLLLAPWSLLIWQQLRPRFRLWGSTDAAFLTCIYLAAVLAAATVLSARKRHASLITEIGATLAGMGVVATVALILAWAIVAAVATLGVKAAWRWEAWASRVTVAMLGAASFSSSFGPLVQDLELQLQGLPPDADGYVLCHLSDLHAGPIVGAPELQRLASLVASLRCRAVVLNGDVAEGTVEERASEASELRSLASAPDGAYFVPGNHEYYNFHARGGARRSAEEWTAWWSRLGFRSLNNSHVQLPLQTETKWFTLAGVDDVLGAPDIAKALADRAKPGLPTILLAHRPWPHVKSARREGVEVQISGHTHGGQLWPLHVLAWYAGHGYVSGLYTLEDGPLLYVADGTIGSYQTRMRLLTRAEVTRVIFRSGPCTMSYWRQATFGLAVSFGFLILALLTCMALPFRILYHQEARATARNCLSRSNGLQSV